MKRLSAKIRPRFRDHERDRSPVIRAVLKSGVQGEETVAKRLASTVRRTDDLECRVGLARFYSKNRFAPRNKVISSRY